MFQIVDHVPPGLLDAGPQELDGLLGAPTLIELDGRRGPPLFVSTLLHGNEPVGFQAIKRVLARYRPGGGDAPLPRSLRLFIGNVSAAARGLRRLDGQPDYNRCWPGGPADGSAEQAMMTAVVDRMRGQGLFASVDVHNNTGRNPHYACVNVLGPAYLQLAALFSRTVVWFTRPRGVQSLAFAELCPAVTLECGRPGDVAGVEHAARFIDACLHLAELPPHPPAPRDIDVMHTVARVQVPEAASISINGAGADVRLVPGYEDWNFRPLTPGTVVAEVRGDAAPLIVHDNDGRDAFARFFAVEGDTLVTRLPVIPSMLTRDERVIRQDCLCYLMERIEPQAMGADDTPAVDVTGPADR